MNTLLTFYVSIRDLGRVLFAPFQVKLGPDLPGREPDLLFVVRERLDRLQETYLDGPADLIVEIVSPESQRRDRGAKFYEYEAAGVGEYWLIDLPTPVETLRLLSAMLGDAPGAETVQAFLGN